MGYRRLPDDKLREEVFGWFLRLCKDETPLVRRTAAQALESWTRLLGGGGSSSDSISSSPAVRQRELFGAFRAFINDDQVGKLSRGVVY